MKDLDRNVLTVSDLWINYKTQGKTISAVRGVTFSLAEKVVMGVVGESGSGKSSIGLAIMRLLPKNAKTTGTVQFLGSDVTRVPKDRMPEYRGTGMTMIFQEPMTSLNPVMRIGTQLAEAITVRRERRLGKKPNEVFSYDVASPDRTVSPVQSWFGLKRSAPSVSSLTMKEAIQALKKVRITDPERTAAKYPHELSGGERQRVMISMAYLLRPKLLVADEPTTALDVTTQAQILKLMLELRDEIGTSMIFISHDLLVVGQVADDIAVMYAGEIVEITSAKKIFEKPLHPYTQGLIKSIPTSYKNEGRVSSIQQGQQGEVPQLLKGCKFHTRCQQAFGRCSVEEPKLREVEENHYVSCHLY